MWIFTRYGFFSFSVRDNKVWIRSRKKPHLQSLKDRFLLDGTIVESHDTDYRYRLMVDKEVAAGMMYTLSFEQDWSNFKNEASRSNKDRSYIMALHDVWERMYGIQE